MQASESHKTVMRLIQEVVDSLFLLRWSQMPFISGHDMGCKIEVYVIARVASDVHYFMVIYSVMRDEFDCVCYR